MRKKGQLQSLTPAILALIFAAIILVFGMVMSQELVNSISADQAGTGVNETMSIWVGVTNQSLNAVNRCGATGFAVIGVWNDTLGVPLAAGNYTFYADGNIINSTNDVWSNGVNKWDVDYTYSWAGEACEAGNTTIAGLGTFADFWEIIVLAIVISIVIGLLLVVFGGSGGRRR